MFESSAARRNAEARRWISPLEGRWQQSERQIAELQSEQSRETETQDRVMTALEAEVARLKEGAGGMGAQAALPARVNRAEADTRASQRRPRQSGSCGQTSPVSRESSSNRASVCSIQ
jgi:TolA-binding protein